MKTRILFIFLLFSFFVNKVFSCCAKETRCLTEMLLTRKTPIYYAKVISSTDNNGEWSAKLEVIESFFNSNSADTISIKTGGISHSTGGAFLKKGSIWLIYDGFSICSNFTKQSDTTQKFLSELKMLRQIEDVIVNKKSRKINITDSKGNVSLSANFNRGLPNGNFEHYYSNGKIKTKSKYVNGVKEGLWTHYYKEGRIKSTLNYKNGKQTLSASYRYVTKYYSNGNVKEEYTIKNSNSVDGEWNIYYENGNLKSTQLYSDNKLIGTLKKYQIDGVEIE